MKPRVGTHISAPFKKAPHYFNNHRISPFRRDCMYGQPFQQSMDQPGMVANSARGQLNRGKKGKKSLSPFAPENVVSPDRFSRPVRR